jgi:4-hydroxy-tetrahydrodipicolinate synthase
MFSGSYVAMVTPWTEDGSRIDFDAIRELVEFHVRGGTDGILPAGTTGESATLTHEEQRELMEKVVQFVDGRTKVLAGAGSNSTAEAVSLAKHAKSVGADGVLVITPYYNKPTPEGLFRHFEAVAGACDLPVMMYNVPGRTGTNMAPETSARIFREVGNVVAIKDATDDVDQANDLMNLCDIAVLSGADSLTYPLMALGGKGVVSVIANIVPDRMKALCDAAAAGDFQTAREIHFGLLPLMRTMFCETNPIPVKTATRLMGLTNGVFRLPLCDLRPENLERVTAALREAGLL